MSDLEKPYSDSGDESSKPVLLTKKKKKSEKPSYKMFDADDSDSEPVLYDDSSRSTAPKLKKHSRPSFKFANKIKSKEKDKEDRKEKVGDKDEKDGVKIKQKTKDKDPFKMHKKKNKAEFTSQKVPEVSEVDYPVFGVALSVAVERTPSNDGVLLPICVRECIDYIEEHGLLYEGIYRISGVKSKVQMLKDCYNRRQVAHLYEHDPSIVASLLKQFLRELPDSVLTTQILPKFEEASVIVDSNERLDKLAQCINSLPPCNKDLLSWMIVHMNHVIAKEKINKMSLQNVSIVLSPTMRISHRVLNVLFMHSDDLFAKVRIIRYKPSLQPAASKWSVDMPDTEEAIEDELRRQDMLLNQMHQVLLRFPADSEQEDKLWEIQRTITALKRKLKLISKTNAAKQLEKQLSTEDVSRADPKRRSINTAELNFALQTSSIHRSRQSIGAASTHSSSAAINELPSSSAEGAHDHQYTEVRKTDLSRGYDDHQENTTTDEVTENQASQEPTTEYSNVENDNVQDETITKDGEDNPIKETGETYQEETISTDRAEEEEDSELPVQSESPVEVAGSETEAESPGEENNQALTDAQLKQKLTAVNAAAVSIQSSDANSSTDPSIQVYSLHMTKSTSQDSDVTISAASGSDITGSISLQSFTDHKIEADSMAQTMIAEDPVDQKVSSPHHQNQMEATEPQILIPERLHSSVTEADEEQLEGLHQEQQMYYSIENDEELKKLIAEEAQLIWEEEELIAIKDELKKNIETERLEIERLQEEIIEYEELRSITTLGHSSEAVSSEEYYSSTSDTTDASDEESGQQEIDSLVAELQKLTSQNEQLERSNTELVRKLDEERMDCLNVKIQIRLHQQRILSNQAQEQSLI